MGDVEFNLLASACRVAVDARPLILPSAGIRWERLLTLAERHRVEALCWRGLQATRDRMPEFARAQLKDRARNIVIENVKAAQECDRLLKPFQAGKVPLLFLKGLTVGALAYGDPFLKMSVDIDLFVEEQSITAAARIMRDAGYCPVVPAEADDAMLVRWHRRRKESVWRHQDGGFQVDLHTRLADHPAMLSDLDVWPQNQNVGIGSGIELPTLADADLFAYLCVHGSSSAWFRMKWITDLVGILAGRSCANIEGLYQHSKSVGAGRSSAQALLLAERVHRFEIGNPLRQRLAADPANHWLVRLAERQLLNRREPTERLLGTATIHLSQFGLMPGWRFKRSEAARQFQDLFARDGG